MCPFPNPPGLFLNHIIQNRLIVTSWLANELSVFFKRSSLAFIKQKERESNYRVSIIVVLLPFCLKNRKLVKCCSYFKKQQGKTHLKTLLLTKLTAKPEFWHHHSFWHYEVRNSCFKMTSNLSSKIKWYLHISLDLGHVVILLGRLVHFRIKTIHSRHYFHFISKHKW